VNAGGAASVGGLIGDNDGSVTGCYYYQDPDNGIGNSTDSNSMKQQSTYSGWDFGGATWWINPDVNSGYPYLVTNPLAVNGLTAKKYAGSIVLAWVSPKFSRLDHIEVTWEPGGSVVQTVSAGTETYTPAINPDGIARIFTVRTVYTNGRCYDAAVFLAAEPPAGDTETCDADGVSFVMAYVPGGIFPTGMYDESTATVADAYWIGETEVTYELWKKVYDWATSGTTGTGAGEYTFANQGREGNDGTIGAAATNQEPVTTVNWRDSMVWCNALTEWYNAHTGASVECVYTYSSEIIRDSRDSNATACDNAIASSTAKGFRLLTSNEWELAARYRGTDTTNVVTRTVLGVDFSAMTTKWTKGNSASAATTYYNDSTGGSGEPGKTANDAVAVYSRYWDGDSWETTGVTGTAAVKSKGVSGANGLGVYDMSGNVWEWCFDLNGSSRVGRGSSWSDSAYGVQVGYWSSSNPSSDINVMGFRFARSAD
jgi:formylglycine-generating enzyme required for sulfatase activity